MFVPDTFFNVVVVQSISHVWLFATPWTAARQASLSFTISRSLLKLLSIEFVMPSNHLSLCRLLLLLPSIFPSIRVFNNESALPIRWPVYSASVLPVNIHGWFPVWRRLLRVPWTARRSNQSILKEISPKGNQSWISIGRTDAEAETQILWPPDGKNWLIGQDLMLGKI